MQIARMVVIDLVGFLSFHTMDDIEWRVEILFVYLILIFFSISILNNRILINSSKTILLLTNRHCLYT